MEAKAFGNYIVREKIGEGGMGEIFLAEHRRMGRKAAIKILRTHGCQSQLDVERFFNEARAASMIDHPGVVQVFDCDFCEQGAYLTMEYLEGESLAARLHHPDHVSTDTEFIHAIGTQIANVLAAAHAKGIVHRDLKPDNVFLEKRTGASRHGLVRILDFGIAKLISANATVLTKTGILLGTPAYMAPEQCAGDRDIDTRADIYSLGCILFEMAAGVPPFVRAGAGSLITAHMSEPPPSLDEVWAGAPAAFVSLLAQMLAKEPADRPQTMGEVESRLHDCLSPATGRVALPFSAAAGSAPATAVLPLTQPIVEIPPHLRGAAAPEDAAAIPTAVLPGSEASSLTPTVTLPTEDGRMAGPQRSGATRAAAHGDVRAIITRLTRERIPWIVAGVLVVAFGLLLGLLRSAGKPSLPASVQPTRAPITTPPPDLAPAVQPEGAPEADAPSKLAIPAAERPAPPSPSTATPSDAVAPHSRSARRTTMVGKDRAATPPRAQPRAQPRKEIRGFSDF